jgi:hypothetical protein
MMANLPTGIEPCLNPAVLENTSTFVCADAEITPTHIIAMTNVLIIVVLFMNRLRFAIYRNGKRRKTAALPLFIDD